MELPRHFSFVLFASFAADDFVTLAPPQFTRFCYLSIRWGPLLTSGSWMIVEPFANDDFRTT